jgi:hypothetical protein
MADKLGVSIVEKDQSKSASPLVGPQGAMAIYCKQGRTDEAPLMDSEEAFLKMFGNPHVEMDLYGSVKDVGRSMLNALAFIKAGMPTYIKRAIPSSGGVKAEATIQTDGASGTVKAIAKGHGTYYNGLSIVMGGIDAITRNLTLKKDVKFSLGETAMPGTVMILDAGSAKYGIAPNFDTVVLATDEDVDIEYEEAVAIASIGNITCVAQANIIDGETVTISDGINELVFEFDKSVIRGVGAGNISVDIYDAVTAQDVRDALKAAIDNSILEVTTANNGTDGIDLTQDNAGNNGNKVIEETVADAGFTVTGFEGGADLYDTTLLYNGTAAGATIQLTIYYETTEPLKRNFRLYIVNDGEVDPKSNVLEDFHVALVSTATDQNGTNIYIGNIIDENSDIIDSEVSSVYLTTAKVIGTDISKYATDAKALVGGADGTYGANDVDIASALDTFREKKYDFLKMFDAGYSDLVKRRIAAVCRERVFPAGIVDPTVALYLDGLVPVSTLPEAEDVVEWRTAIGIPSTDQEFVFLAGSTWGRITDEYNEGRKVWMPPSYETGQTFVIVNGTLGPWKSLMGPRRGVTGFEKLVVDFYDDRNTLNVKQCNPLIVDERGVQMFYGNKTLKTVASAMQQLHARITRGYISRELYFECLDWIAEDNVESTWNELQDRLDEIIQTYSEALEDYKIVVGPPKTTDADINNQVLRIGIGLIFNQIIEEVVIEITVFRNGTELDVSIV